MKDAVLFNGPNSLDRQDLREKVIRIPEVIRGLRRAQEIWDASEYPAFDLANFLASEDKIFLGNIRLKTLAAAVVQIGLYERYVKNFRAPEFLIGNTNGDSALKVVAGLMSFDDMLATANSFRMLRSSPQIPFTDAPLLAGVSLTEYGLARSQAEGGYEVVEDHQMDVEKLIFNLAEKRQVRKIVNIGPGGQLMQPSLERLSLSEVQVIESIDMDPLLNWFWNDPRKDLQVG
jgi:hypothetical protein